MKTYLSDVYCHQMFLRIWNIKSSYNSLVALFKHFGKVSNMDIHKNMTQENVFYSCKNV